MAYIKTTWENEPSESTPINASNLNKIEDGIYNNSLKADQVGNLTNLKTSEKSTLVGAINEIINKESYSTTEVKTDRTWVDNKPIYQMVIDYTIARSTNTWNAVNTLNNIDKIFIKEVTAFVGNEYYLNVWQTYSFYYNKSDSKLYERHTSSYYEGNHMFIVLEYTKTTD